MSHAARIRSWVLATAVVAVTAAGGPVTMSAMPPGRALAAQEPADAPAEPAEETVPAGLTAAAREVLLSVRRPDELPSPDPSIDDRERALRILDGDIGRITFQLPPGTSGDFGIRPTVVDEEQGLIRVDILTAGFDRRTLYFRVEESFELVVGGEAVRSSAVSGFTFAATEIRPVSAARESSAPPATATRQPPGDTVQAPVPGSPTIASRPGPPTPELAQDAGSRAGPGAPTEPIVLRIGLPDRTAAPVLTLQEGATGTVTLPDGSSFGFKPTRFLPAGTASGLRALGRGVVRVEILDLATSPSTRLGAVDIQGDDSVRSSTDPAFTIAVLAAGQNAR